MKIKLDENLPVRLALILSSLHHDIHTVGQENLSGKSDRYVWEAAQRDARFLITQDLDFRTFDDLFQERTKESCSFDSGLPTVRASSGVFRKCSSMRT